ncbi:hypothetical protein CXB51_018462 [Gossypium anomalum]|uniref:Reverse transcriptase n=1 Tax=Gossypium anomalum TaxID=47600 RepID=A0A8J6CZR0_9ROSI|nr:hypothetical protein CXB51_018462 [Gossypium anomalum]
MSGCLAVSSNGRNGGLAMLWRDGIEVIIQSYSNMHINSMVQMENKNYVRFTDFYGQADPNHRNLSWDMLRRIGRTVKENWIVGEVLNEILDDDDEKEGGRRKLRVLMEDFRSVLEELALVDIKTSRGWFTWINNREGDAMVKERLNRFVFSSTACRVFPYIDTFVIRQTSPYHEAIMLDTLGKKPKEKQDDLRRLYEEDEIYWAQRSRIKWLKEGDRNTKIFHVRATSRRKKNDIDRLKDNNGCWVYNSRDKCRVARDYFIDLFQTSTNTVNNIDICCIPKCVNEEMNKNLMQSFTDKEILRAFNQIDLRKAPGIDGLPGIFFKEN